MFKKVNNQEGIKLQQRKASLMVQVDKDWRRTLSQKHIRFHWFSMSMLEKAQWNTHYIFMQGPGTLLERFSSSRLVCFSYFTYRKIAKKNKFRSFCFHSTFLGGGKQKQMYQKKIIKIENYFVCYLKYSFNPYTTPPPPKKKKPKQTNYTFANHI